MGFAICSIPCTAQTINDTCICGEVRIKAVEMLAVDARTNKAAYEQERKTRLQDSSNYNYSISRLEKSILEIQEALKFEQATPKTIVKSNIDWWKFGLGGAVIGGLVYFLIENFVIKK